MEFNLKQIQDSVLHHHSNTLIFIHLMFYFIYTWYIHKIWNILLDVYLFIHHTAVAH